MMYRVGNLLLGGKVLKIVELKAFEGRNIYSHRKTVKMVIELDDWMDIPTLDIKGFNSNALDTLPGLKEHRCSPGYVGGFIERLNTGTYLPHVIEHITIEILNILGEDVSFGKTRRIGNSSSYSIVYEYLDKTKGLEAGKLAFQFAKTLCEQTTFDFIAALNMLKAKVLEGQFGPSTQAIIDAALERKIPFIKIGKESLIQFGYGKYQKRIKATVVENTSCIAVDISCDKTITKLILKESGIPVPEGDVCTKPHEASEIAEEIGYPVVIKPENGNQGKGVSLNISNPQELIEAFITASKYDDNVMVERHIRGNDYRVLVINGRVAAVARRIPAHIIGDGVHNIFQLVQKVNLDPKRGNDHEKPLSKIKIDDISIRLLQRKGYNLDTIPTEGELIYLKENGNISTGGEAHDCTDRIHPKNYELAVRAAKVIGLDIGGIDITCPDISNPISETEGAIIEVNAAPGIRMHLFPSKGKPQKVGHSIVEMMFPSGSKHSIPIVSITGTNGKTTTSRMVSHIFEVFGMNVGMAVTGGIYINNKCIIKGDTTGPASAKTVLMDKSIDAAVLETARGGIIRAGLAYDLSDVGVLTNLSEDHLGLDGVETIEDLLYVKSLVLESIKRDGFAVLNADDPMVVKVSQRVKCNIIYFSKREDNLILHKHLLSGGKAIFLKKDYIVIATGNGNIQSLPIAKIPSTYEGKLVHNVENCLAAIAVAYSMTIPISIIEKAMISFYCDELQNPGRFNVFNIRDFRVIVDYGHNVAGYKLMGDAIKRMNASRLVGIVGMPGDRDDYSIKEVGQAAANIFHKIIIKEDADLRNRKAGEVPRLLEEGILSQGMGRDNIEIILPETEALEKAMKEALPGDLIVIFYEKLEPVLEIIKRTPKTNYNNSHSHLNELVLMKKGMEI